MPSAPIISFFFFCLFLWAGGGSFWSILVDDMVFSGDGVGNSCRKQRIETQFNSILFKHIKNKEQ